MGLRPGEVEEDEERQMGWWGSVEGCGSSVLRCSEARMVGATQRASVKVAVVWRRESSRALEPGAC